MTQNTLEDLEARLATAKAAESMVWAQIKMVENDAIANGLTPSSHRWPHGRLEILAYLLRDCLWDVSTASFNLDVARSRDADISDSETLMKLKEKLLNSHRSAEPERKATT